MHHSHKMHICLFPDYLTILTIFNQFLFFGHVLLLLEIKNKLTKFSTKFQLKQAKFLPFKCASLLVRSKLVQQNSLYFFKIFKTVRLLRVDEIRPTSRNAFAHTCTYFCIIFAFLHFFFPSERRIYTLFRTMLVFSIFLLLPVVFRYQD